MAPEVSDNCDQGVADAEAAVSAAEQAVQDAQDALTAANNDAFITPEEVADLQAKYQAAEDALGAAQAAVDALPAKNGRAECRDRINALDNITVPEVSDNFDQGVADAEAAVSAAEQAVQDAQDALTAANNDAFITPEEVADLQAKYQAAEDALGAAQAAVDALPASDAKNDFQDRINALSKVKRREGSDNFDQGVADAEAAVSAAEQAVQDAQDALTAANNDAFITPEEVADLQAKYQAAEDALGAAQAAVDALPASDAKNDFQDRIDALENITVPEVSQTYEDAVNNATDLLADAKAAVDAAEQALEDAIADGKVEQSEVDALIAAKDAAQTELDAAEAAIDALPAGSAKDDLVAELGTEQDRLDAIEVPAVDGDAFDNAADLLADAKAAVDAAEQALEDAIADGKVEQSDRKGVVEGKDAAQTELDAAEAAIDGLPAGSAKDDLVAELGTEQDRLDAIEVPAVDGGAFDNAADLLADAKAAVDAAEQALEDAIADGKVEQSEVDALVAAKDAAQTRSEEH